MSLTKFGWVDIVFVTLLVRVCYIGFKNGFLSEIFRLLGLFSAFILSVNNYTLVSGFLLSHTKRGGLSLEVVSFLFIFLATLFMFKLIARVAGLLSNSENVSLSNRVTGLVIGLCRGALLISLIYTLFINSHVGYLSKSVREKSILSQYVAGIAPAAYDIGINLYPLTKIDTPIAVLLNK